MHLYFIRHGQSAANAAGAHAGWQQVPLTELGVEQAKITGELVKSIKFDKVITSDLIRAMDTADYALPNYEKLRDSRLREISVGSLAGKTVKECEAELGESYTCNKLNHDFTPYGGEKMDDLLSRVAEFMDDFREEPMDAKIAVVCHEGAIYAALCHVLGFKLSRFTCAASNCSVSVFEYNGSRWLLHKWNQTGSVEIQD